MARGRPWWVGPVVLAILGLVITVGACAAAAGLWVELEQRGNALLSGLMRPLVEEAGYELPRQQSEDDSVWVVVAFAGALGVAAIGLLVMLGAALWAAIAGYRATR